MAITESNPRNPAVIHCIEAYNHTLESERAHGSSDSKSVDRAKQAFCAAMPHLEDRRSIRNFIACVAWGQVNGIIWCNSAPKWLYSAQVALQALPPEPRPAPGRPTPATSAPAQTSTSAPVPPAQPSTSAPAKPSASAPVQPTPSAPAQPSTPAPETP